MDFIYEIPNFVHKEFCKHMILKHDQITDKDVEVDDSEITENSIDLNISRDPKWKKECKYLGERLNLGMKKYISSLEKHVLVDEEKRSFNCIKNSNIFNKYKFGEFQLQKYKNGGHYTFRQDFDTNDRSRFVGFIFYLNDVDTSDGGEDDFTCGKRIGANHGNLVFFPATWTYFHRGIPVKHHSKFVITGFVHLED